MPEFKSVLDVKKYIGEVTNEWVYSWSKEKVREFVYSKLNRQTEEIICKILGFECSWNEWDIDHCNGRMSKITELLKGEADKAVQEWLHENISKVTDNPMTKNQLKVIKEDYQSNFNRKFRQIIRQKVDEEAEKAAAKFLEDMFKDKTLDAYVESLAGLDDLRDTEL